MTVSFVVEGVGFEPTNSIAERIYSPRPLATWISLQRTNVGFEKPQRDEQGKRKSKQTNDEGLRLKVDYVLLDSALV